MAIDNKDKGYVGSIGVTVDKAPQVTHVDSMAVSVGREHTTDSVTHVDGMGFSTGRDYVQGSISHIAAVGISEGDDVGLISVVYL